MNLQRFIRKCKAGSYIIRTKARPSFSQAGEDQVVSYLFQSLQIPRPSYLDVGTNHPLSGNNTFFFYNKGSKGVCIEPDPDFFRLIKKYRHRDTVLNVGIGLDNQQKAELYIFPDPYSGWNTFSFEEAKYREEESGIAIKKKETIPLLTIDSVMGKYFDPHPNFLSIDVEGMDLAILKSIDFTRYMPEVICAETITFSTKNEESKVNDITDFLKSKGYFVFADTHINTIFCRSDIYKKIA